MTWLETFVASPFANALGWALLHSLWQGAILAGVLLCVMFAARSPRIRYATACIAMLAMAAALVFTFVREFPDAGAAASRLSPVRFTNVTAGAIQALRGIQDTTAFAPWLAPLWLIGVMAFYGWHAAGLLFVRRLGMRGVCEVPGRWNNDLARLSALLGVARPVRLLESCFAETPAVLGHLKPVILIPIGLLAGLPAGQVEALLLHELAHIRRHDYLVNAIQRMIEGLFFYHPAAWWIGSVIRAERENCCDDIVAGIRDAHEYATALATLEQTRSSNRLPAVAASGGNLVNRIRRLLYPQTSHLSWPPFLAAIMLLAIIAVPLSAWQSQQTPNSTEVTALAPDSLYAKWINQDVVYIVTDAERGAFLKLTTDDERKQFIEQFWDRRNPTPGTQMNAFKEEHYRRIAFANAHYTTASKLAGWQTDRGHTYILYGPPDEIESHPKPAAPQLPYESWRYHHIEGIGDNVDITFVDRTGTGDYRMAPTKGR